MAAVELNVDLGEKKDEPVALYSLATTVNVACGGHAGDLASMARAVSFALARGVKIAAHPSYPDKENFGRVSMAIEPDALAASIREQCIALKNVAEKIGHSVIAMKPHGALYHDAARDPAIAAAILDGATAALGDAIAIVGPPHGRLFDVARARGLPYLREGFADRGYAPDGTLLPRTMLGALIEDPNVAARQALELARHGGIDTICVHGDTPGAAIIAQAVRDALASARVLAGT